MNLIQQDFHNIKILDRKFMVSGYSFLSNDADFGIIKTYNKTKPIFFNENTDKKVW